MIAAVRGADILGLILVTAGVGALRLGGSVLIAKRFLPSLRILQVPDPAGIREVFGYGVYTFLTQVMSSLWRNLDRILLGIFAGPAAIAYVIVPADLLLKVTGAIGSASSVLFPRFTSLKESLQKTRDIFWVSTWVTLSLTILIFVPATILMEPFLSLWINPEFAANSARVAQLIAFSNIIRGAFIPYDSLYKGQGRPQYLAGLYLITGTISVIVDTLLISQFGLAGAGYSYIATVGVGVGMIILTKQKILREESWQPFCQSVLLPSIAAFLFLAFFGTQNFVSVQRGWWHLIWAGTIIFLSVAGTLLALDVLIFRKTSYIIMGIQTLRIKTRALG
jgi:O-antigen/teichoic acid export membrane protein